MTEDLFHSRYDEWGRENGESRKEVERVFEIMRIVNDEGSYTFYTWPNPWLLSLSESLTDHRSKYRIEAD